jgi:hypothetical protein
MRVAAFARRVNCSQSTISPRKTSDCIRSDCTIIAAAWRTSARWASVRLGAPPRSSASDMHKSRYRLASAVRPSTLASSCDPFVTRLRSVGERSAAAVRLDKAISEIV